MISVQTATKAVKTAPAVRAIISKGVKMATVMRVAARNALAIQSFKVISKALFFIPPP